MFTPYSVTIDDFWLNAFRLMMSRIVKIMNT